MNITDGGFARLYLPGNGPRYTRLSGNSFKLSGSTSGCGSGSTLPRSASSYRCWQIGTYSHRFPSVYYLLATVWVTMPPFAWIHSAKKLHSFPRADFCRYFLLSLSLSTGSCNNALFDVLPHQGTHVFPLDMTRPRVTNDHKIWRNSLVGLELLLGEPVALLLVWDSSGSPCRMLKSLMPRRRRWCKHFAAHIWMHHSDSSTTGRS